MAWIVLWASFIACVALAVAVPAAARWYMAGATETQEATLEIISGTVLVRDPATGAWIGASNKMKVREGDGIRTDDVSRALVTLFDGSPIVLYPRTEVTILRSQASRFEPHSNFITLMVPRGYLRVAVAPQAKSDENFSVLTPHGRVMILKDGSYSVEVTDTGSQISVREGEAQVSAAGGAVDLRRSQRTIVEPGKPPSQVLKAARELVANGDFRQGLAGWRESSNLEVKTDVEGAVMATEADGAGAVRFLRTASRSSHAENAILQTINRDVSDLLSLKLSLDVLLSNQSLSGGGFRGSEYPAMVQVRYRDVDGNEQLWVRGFFYQNTSNYSVLNGEQVLRNSWYPYEREIIGPAGISPRPFYIISVQLSASGWDYDSMVRNVSLVGE